MSIPCLLIRSYDSSNGQFWIESVIMSILIGMGPLLDHVSQVSEKAMVDRLESKHVEVEDLRKTPIWTEFEIDNEGEMTEEDYRGTYSQFVKGLDGVDTNFKAMALYHAVYKEMEESKYIDKTRCNVCGQKIRKDRFAEEFVDAYHQVMIKKKTSISGSMLKGAYEVGRRKWASALVTLFGDILPTVRKYMSTSPTKLNQADCFPYYISEDEDGDVTVFHDSCYQQQKIE